VRNLKETEINRILDFSILSFRRNHNRTNESAWIDGVFGSKAIFYQRAGTSAIREKNTTSGLMNFKKAFTLPSYVSRSECSFELLGFVALNRELPFETANRENLIIGDAMMHISGTSSTWNCFYRPMYEVWRMNKSFWQVFFYCPSHNNTMCTENDEMKSGRKLDGEMLFQTHNITWKSTISLRSKLKHVLPTKVENNHAVEINAFVQPAACLALPYQSSDGAKVVTNGAIIFEWVRYHALMGFKVYVYDRGGANRRNIFNSKYGNMQKQRGMMWLANVVYRPYTVFGRLEKLGSQLTFDSSLLNDTNKEAQYKLEYLDNDKTATLTQCRFEASNVHGADNVIVADFDEFLFCPSAARTFQGQQYFVGNLISKYRSHGYGQLIFLQMWAAAKLFGGKYSSPRECLIDMVEKGNSIFDCFTGYNHNAGTKFVGKSLHLGHSCPLTDFHSSCQSGDCTCPTLYGGDHRLFQTLPREERCYFIHLSTNAKDYKYHLFDNDTRAVFEEETSELAQILQNPNYPKIRRHETRASQSRNATKKSSRS
jgi:hypothetical protein